MNLRQRSRHAAVLLALPAFHDGMVQTHRRLAGARVKSRSSASLPSAGEPVHAAPRLDRRGARTASLRDHGPLSPAAFCRQLDARGDVVVNAPAAERGPWRAPLLRLEARAPFGLFRAGRWLQLDVGTDVDLRVPTGTARPAPDGDDARAAAATRASKNWRACARFREGDSPRQVAWKAYARGITAAGARVPGHGRCHRTPISTSLNGLDTERAFHSCAGGCSIPQRGEFWTLVLPRQNACGRPGRGAHAGCLTALSSLARHPLRDALLLPDRRSTRFPWPHSLQVACCTSTGSAVVLARWRSGAAAWRHCRIAWAERLPLPNFAVRHAAGPGAHGCSARDLPDAEWTRGTAAALLMAMGAAKVLETRSGGMRWCPGHDSRAPAAGGLPRPSGPAAHAAVRRDAYGCLLRITGSLGISTHTSETLAGGLPHRRQVARSGRCRSRSHPVPVCAPPPGRLVVAAGY